jgi:hypothetical protein
MRLGLSLLVYLHLSISLWRQVEAAAELTAALTAVEAVAVK